MRVLASHVLELLGVSVVALSAVSVDPAPPQWPNPSVQVAGYDALEDKPLIVMHAGGPWASDCLRGPGGDARRMGAFFAAYDDGTVIYTRAVSDGCEEMEAHVAPERVRALVDELVDVGVLGLPREQHVASCTTDAGGSSITLRVGNAWHRSRAIGVNQFGEAVCAGELQPSLAFVRAVQRLTAFDPPGATSWVPRAFAIRLTPGRFLPDASASPVAWPDGLPLPALSADEDYPEIVYDARYLQAARSVGFAPGQYACSFVVLHGRTWAYHVTPGVLPAHAYLQKVEKAR